jgi:hypothetical protein
LGLKLKKRVLGMEKGRRGKRDSIGGSGAERYAISARTLYIKTSTGYTSESGIEKNNYLSAQKRNLLLK